MTKPPLAACLVHDARARAGLTQRELAERAQTAQSVVARIERGATSPTVDTLQRLLAAAGFELQAELVRVAGFERRLLDDVPRILRMSPEDRLREIRNISRLVTGARPV